jgi:hypothetical protein
MANSISRRSTILAAAIFAGAVSAFPTVGLAGATDEAVSSGGWVTWSGSATNLDVILCHNGNGRVNGTPTPIAGAYLQTKTDGTHTQNAVFSTEGSGSQGACGVYYVYYDQYKNGTNTLYQLVISTIAPWPEGLPSANLAYRASDGTQVAGNENAVFLGSYLTDSNSHIVPFDRHGEQTYLLYDLAATNGSGTEGLAGPSFSWSNGNNYPASQHAFIGGTNTCQVNPQQSWQFPKSASGAIITMQASTSSPNFVNIGVFDPALAPAVGATSWYANFLVNPPAAWAIVARRIIVPLDSSGFIWVADFQSPPTGKTDSLIIQYVGYIESITHPGQ